MSLTVLCKLVTRKLWYKYLIADVCPQVFWTFNKGIIITIKSTEKMNYFFFWSCDLKKLVCEHFWIFFNRLNKNLNCKIFIFSCNCNSILANYKKLYLNVSCIQIDSSINKETLYHLLQHQDFFEEKFLKLDTSWHQNAFGCKRYQIT